MSFNQIQEYCNKNHAILVAYYYDRYVEDNSRNQYYQFEYSKEPAILNRNLSSSGMTLYALVMNSISFEPFCWTEDIEGECLDKTQKSIPYDEKKQSIYPDKYEASKFFEGFDKDGFWSFQKNYQNAIFVICDKDKFENIARICYDYMNREIDKLFGGHYSEHFSSKSCESDSDSDSCDKSSGKD